MTMANAVDEPVRTTAETLWDLAMIYPPSLIPCRSQSGDLWFSSERGEQKKAMAWCAACPIVDTCRDTARTIQAGYGIWGGESAHKRRKAGYASNRS